MGKFNVAQFAPKVSEVSWKSSLAAPRFNENRRKGFHLCPPFHVVCNRCNPSRLWCCRPNSLFFVFGTSDISVTEEEEAPEELFAPLTATQRIWRRYPGVLTATMVLETQRTMMLQLGASLPEAEKAGVRSIILQYCRQQLSQNMSPPVAREALHWAATIDMLLEGRVSAALDVMCQRLKSLEGLSRGLRADCCGRVSLVFCCVKNKTSRVCVECCTSLVCYKLGVSRNFQALHSPVIMFTLVFKEATKDCWVFVFRKSNIHIFQQPFYF